MISQCICAGQPIDIHFNGTRYKGTGTKHGTCDGVAIVSDGKLALLVGGHYVLALLSPNDETPYEIARRYTDERLKGDDMGDAS